MRYIGLTVLLLAVTAASAFAQATRQSPGPSSAPSAQTPAAIVELHGVIDDYSSDLLIKRFNQAKLHGAKTIIVELNTPGGLVHAALDITRFLRSQSDVHTIAYVDEMALSAGIIIGLACDELVMAPESKIGDAAPIVISDSNALQTLGETERAKAESPILADVYASSIRNGYDPLLTSSMVTLRRVVHYVQSESGEKKFVGGDEYKKLTEAGWKPVAGVRDPLDSADELLTVQSDTAEKIGLSKGTYATPEKFAATRNLNIVATLRPGSGEKFIGWLSSDWVRGILIVILLQALYFAFGHPGHGWPEVIALVSLGLIVGVPLLTGYATWWEVVAILLGLVLLAMEIFVIPGFGVAGIAGLILVFAGLVLTFVGTEPSIPGVLPSLSGTWASLQRGLFIVAGGLACSLFLWIWLNRYLPKIPYFNRLILTTIAGDIASGAVSDKIETGPAVGDVGVTLTELKPGGSVKFITAAYPEGRVASVISESGFILPGTKVIVREAAGNRIIVRKEEA